MANPRFQLATTRTAGPGDKPSCAILMRPQTVGFIDAGSASAISDPIVDSFLSRRTALLTAIVAPALVAQACARDRGEERHEDVSPPAQGNSEAPSAETAPSATSTASPSMPRPSLAPATAIDSAFAGCQEGCSVEHEVDPASVVVQPTARVGDIAYCPVSGAAFAVTGASHRKQVGDVLLFFCCAACMHYFADNEERVLALRGIQTAG